MYLPSKADLSLYLNLQIHPGPVTLKAAQAAVFHLCKLRLCPGPTKSPFQYVLIFMNQPTFLASSRALGLN